MIKFDPQTVSYEVTFSGDTMEMMLDEAMQVRASGPLGALVFGCVATLILDGRSNRDELLSQIDDPEIRRWAEAMTDKAISYMRDTN